MIELEEINESQFKLEKFGFIIGECPLYNKKYYKFVLQQEKSKIDIGLQTTFFGIMPQVVLYDNKLLLGASDKFRAYDLKGNLIKEYVAFPIFYQFIVQDNKILVVSELSVFLLNGDLDKMWEKDFNEIIDIIEIKDSKIVLSDYNNSLIYLDFLTGAVQE